MIEEELKYYNCLCERIELIKNRIDALEYDLTGVKGVNYDKPVAFGSTDPLLKRIRFIEKSDNIDKLKQILLVEKTHKEIIDRLLKRLNCDDYELIYLKFLRKPYPLTYEELGRLKHYDKGNMFKKVKAIIERMEQM